MFSYVASLFRFVFLYGVLVDTRKYGRTTRGENRGRPDRTYRIRTSFMRRSLADRVTRIILIILPRSSKCPSTAIVIVYRDIHFFVETRFLLVRPPRRFPAPPVRTIFRTRRGQRSEGTRYETVFPGRPNRRSLTTVRNNKQIIRRETAVVYDGTLRSSKRWRTKARKRRYCHFGVHAPVSPENDFGNTLHPRRSRRIVSLRIPRRRVCRRYSAGPRLTDSPSIIRRRGYLFIIVFKTAHAPNRRRFSKRRYTTRARLSIVVVFVPPPLRAKDDKRRAVQC